MGFCLTSPCFVEFLHCRGTSCWVPPCAHTWGHSSSSPVAGLYPFPLCDEVSGSSWPQSAGFPQCVSTAPHFVFSAHFRTCSLPGGGNVLSLPSLCKRLEATTSTWCAKRSSKFLRSHRIPLFLFNCLSQGGRGRVTKHTCEWCFLLVWFLSLISLASYRLPSVVSAWNRGVTPWPEPAALPGTGVQTCSYLIALNGRGRG